MSSPLVRFEAVGQHADKLEGFYTELLGWRFDSSHLPARTAHARAPRGLRAARRAEGPPWWVTYPLFLAGLAIIGIATWWLLRRWMDRTMGRSTPGARRNRTP